MKWVPDMLDPEADQAREVYAHYGLAMFVAQLLEHELVTFVVVSRTIGSAFVSVDERDALEAELFGSTMGRQLRHALAEARIGDAEGELLQAALRTRNLLAHDYFRERAEHLMSERGRNAMLDELERMRDELAAANDALTALTRVLMAQLGVTAEMIEAEVESARRSLDANV